MKKLVLLIIVFLSILQGINSDNASSPPTKPTTQSDEFTTFNRIKPAPNRSPFEVNNLSTDYPEAFAGDPRSSPETETMYLSTRQIGPNNQPGGLQPQPGTQATVPATGAQLPINGNPQIPQSQIPQTGAGTIPQQTPTTQLPQTPNAIVPQTGQQPFLPNQNGAGTFPQTNMQPQFNQQLPQAGGQQFPTGNVSPTLNTPQAQAAYNYMVGEFYNILNDPIAREGLPLLARFFRRLLSSPNALRVLNELDKMMDSNVFGQPGFLNYLQSTLSTPIQSLPYQMQSGSIFDLLKQKLFAVLNYGKDVANAKVKMVNGFFDGGVFAPIARAGTNLVNSGMQAVDGTVTPFFNGAAGSGFGTSGFGSAFPTQFGSPTQFGAPAQFG